MTSPSLRRLVSLTVASVATATPALAETLKTEHFDRDPGWEGKNNRVVPTKKLIVRQDFGYSVTTHASATAGEIGGRVQRSTTPASYALAIPAKTLNDKFSASGTMALTACEGSTG